MLRRRRSPRVVGVAVAVAAAVGTAGVIATPQAQAVTPKLAISTATLPPSRVGVAYADVLHAVGGSAPYSWSATGLPRGLSLNGSTGRISGKPTSAGVATVMVKVSDHARHSVSKTFRLAIAHAVHPYLLENLEILQQMKDNWPGTCDGGCTGFGFSGVTSIAGKRVSNAYQMSVDSIGASWTQWSSRYACTSVTMLVGLDDNNYEPAPVRVTYKTSNGHSGVLGTFAPGSSKRVTIDLNGAYTFTIAGTTKVSEPVLDLGDAVAYCTSNPFPQ